MDHPLLVQIIKTDKHLSYIHGCDGFRKTAKLFDYTLKRPAIGIFQNYAQLVSSLDSLNILNDIIVVQLFQNVNFQRNLALNLRSLRWCF